jgi:hypothetical protein
MNAKAKSVKFMLTDKYSIDRSYNKTKLTLLAKRVTNNGNVDLQQPHRPRLPARSHQVNQAATHQHLPALHPLRSQAYCHLPSLAYIHQLVIRAMVRQYPPVLYLARNPLPCLAYNRQRVNRAIIRQHPPAMHPLQANHLPNLAATHR